MSKKGIVIATDADLATVQIYNNAKCLNCAKASKQDACSSCSDYDENSSLRVLCLNTLGADVGERVYVTACKRQKILFGLLSFIIPVACAVAVYLLLSVFTDDDTIKSRTALAAFVIAMIFAGAYSYKISKNTYDYKIIAKTEDED